MTPTLNYEDEITVLAKVGDFNGFQKADAVINIHELTRFIEGHGKYRTRRYTSGEGTTFASGIKGIGTGDTVKSAVDEECPCSPAYFEASRLLAEHLTIRDRFVFHGSTAVVVIGDKEVTIPPIEYQVDLFHRFDGREAEWVKIDIEINRLQAAIESMGEDPAAMDITIKVSHLPFLPVGGFIVGDHNTDEQKAILKQLWEDNAQNPNGGPLKPPEASVA